MTAASVPIPESSPSSVGKPAPREEPTVPWARIEKFIGQFTHDIRNGLNALELQLTFLGEISTDPEAAAEVKQLRSTLGEITRQLQAVKIKTGSVSVHAMEYPASDFFEDLRERFDRLHASASARISWDAPVAGAVLLIDPELTIHALLELLGNGLQFGGDDAGIFVTASPASGGEGVSIVFRQNLPQAPEVAPERWGHEPLLSTRRSAYGLGLFRARRILEAQGASLDAVSNGTGLAVTVLLPSPKTGVS